MNTSYHHKMNDEEYKSLEIDAAALYILRKQSETLNQRFKFLLKFSIIVTPALVILILFLLSLKY